MRVTTVSRQRATVLIYGQFQSTVKDQIIESRDATVGPDSQRKLSVRTNYEIFVVVFKITGANFKNLN